MSPTYRKAQLTSVAVRVEVLVVGAPARVRSGVIGGVVAAWSRRGMTVEREQMVEELALELEGQDPPGETYPEAVARISTAWATAREVIGETPPMEDTAMDPADAGWIPVVEDPQHPFWRDLREREPERDRPR